MPPKTAVAPAAPPADSQDKYVTIELPTGTTFEDLLETAPADELTEGALEVEADAEPAPPARPARAVVPVVRRPAASPEAEPAPAKRPLTEVSRKAVVPLPKLLQERDKVTLLSGDNARLKAENHRLRAAAIQQRMLDQAKVDPVTITEADQKILQNIAANESDIGKVQIQTAQFLAAKFNAVRTTEATRRTADSEQQRLADSEETIREKHLREKVAKGWDYDSVGTASGIFRAFAADARTGTYYEPATVADIKAAANPAERAYELGLVRLREMGWAPEGEEPEAEEIAEDEQPAAPARPRGKKEPAADASPAEARRASATEVDAAERRGERRGAAAVVDRAAERGRGIRHLPSAGGGPARVQVTAEYLDNLKDRDPDKWLDILRRNPELEYQYMSGSLS